MNWRISIATLVFIFMGCKQEANLTTNLVKETYLIEAEELKSSINNLKIKIIDFRKKEFYENEHISGALNIWRTDIEDNSYDYSGMMASKTQIETLFSNFGIETNDTLIIYDDNGLCNASRLWWILQNYDFKNVKMLHGGLSAWKAINGIVSNEATVITKTTFTLPEKPKMQYYVSKENVLEALTSNTVLLDTRTSDEYSGEKKKKGASKGGRLPKSVNIDWAEAINFDRDKKLKTITDLETIYGKLNRNDTIIVYCHSGVRSAHTTFVLTQLLGFKNVKNYDGSWTEWSHFNNFPFEKDSINFN